MSIYKKLIRVTACYKRVGKNNVGKSNLYNT